MLSGFDITLLAGVLTSMLLTVLSRRAAVPVVIALLAFYVALVGGDPSVVRAALMGALTLLAILAGRRADALTGLAASAFLMTAWRPWTLWEASFQLSFAATLGLIVLEPRIESWIEGRGGSRTALTRENDGTAEASPCGLGHGDAKDTKDKSTFALLRVIRALRGSDRLHIPGWLREALLVSLAAQIATLPITLGTFDRLSLVAPLANLLILPAQAAVMELGALIAAHTPCRIIPQIRREGHGRCRMESKECGLCLTCRVPMCTIRLPVRVTQNTEDAASARREVSVP